MKEKMRRTKGITLIALVVTIVVLLILAGVSINLVVGNNGIITKAIEASNKTKSSSVKDEVSMLLGEWSMENLINGTTLIDYLNQKKDEGEIDEVTATEDGYEIEKDGYIIIVDADGNITSDPSKTAARPVVSNIKVVANSDGTGETLAAKSVTEGTTIYITFETSIDGGEITKIELNGTEVTEVTIPYAVTSNGSYKFTITGTVEGEAKTKTVTVNVNQFDSELEVGDYVNYTYDAVADGYSLTMAVSGYTADQTIAQPTTALQWRVLSINDDGSVDLVSATPTDTTVYFRGAVGYNNGVYALHDMCASLFSNSSLGITARSINIEDIEAQETEAGTTARTGYVNSYDYTYGDTVTYSSNKYYPNLYAYQNGSGTDSTTVKTNGISESDITATGFAIPTSQTYSTATASEGLTVTQTYYNNTLNSTNYGDAGAVLTASNYYWVASRCSDCYSAYAYFGLRFAGSYLYYYGLFGSGGNTGNRDYRLRPVVSLSSDIVNGLTKGSDGTWQIDS